MNPFWEFLKSDAGKVTLTITAMLVSATLATTFFFLNRKRKSIVYEVLSMTRLLGMKEEMTGRVQVLVDGGPVSDVGVVRIQVTNAGTEPLKMSDFSRPISFSVGPSVRIFQADVVEKKPASVDAALNQTDQQVAIVPALLNAKDTITLKLLISNFDGKIQADARIEGAELKERTVLSRIFKAGNVLSSSSAAFALLAAASALKLVNIHAVITPVVLPAIVALFGTTLGYYFGSNKDRPNDYK